MIASFVFSALLGYAWAAACPEDPRARAHPCAPSATEQAEVMGFILQGLQDDAQFQENHAAERALRRAAKEDGSFGTLERWRDAYDRMLERAERRDRNFNEAIRLATLYYGLNHDVSGTIRDGPGMGLAAKWKPRFAARDEFQEKTLVRQSDSSAHSPVFWKAEVGGTIAARTWGDGRVDLYIEAFRKIAKAPNPSGLALTLAHESAHFEDMTGRGRGGPFASEYHAYAKSLLVAEAIGTSQATKDELRGHRDKNRLLAAAETIAPGLLGRLATDTAEIIVEEATLADWAKYKAKIDAIRNEQEKLTTHLAEQRLARAETARFFREIEQRKHAIDAYGELFRWAEIACGVRDWERDIDWNSWIDIFRQVDPGLQRPSTVIPSPCQLHLAVMLLDLRTQGRTSLDIGYVAGLVEEARRRSDAQNLPPARAVARPYNPPRAVASPAVPGAPTEAVSAPSDPDFTVPQGAGDYNRCIHSRCIRWR